LDIQQAGDGSGRLFVVEQAGRIKIIQNGSVLGTPYLDVSALIVSGGETGLLGLAFHPNYSTNGCFARPRRERTPQILPASNGYSPWTSQRRITMEAGWYLETTASCISAWGMAEARAICTA
jgi:hypothetical protein